MYDAADRLGFARKYFGWNPHPTQRRWLLDEHKVKVASCGRRWGKTEAQAIDVATFAVAARGSRQIIISPTYDQSRLIFDSVERLAMKCERTREISTSARSPYPKINIGKSIITARTADEDGRNLRGHWADRVIVDEAAYVKDSVIDEVINPMLADRDGQLILISTPFGKNHFYRSYMLGLGKSERHAAFKFPSWENPHISREYIDQQRDCLTDRQFRTEYEAEFLDDQNSVFPWADIESAIDTQPAAEAPTRFRVAGIDWARYSDYTVVVVVEAGESPQRVVAFDRFNRYEWQVQVPRVAEFLKKHGVNEALADQTSIGDPLLEQLRNTLYEKNADVNLQGMTFTNAGKREIIDNLQIRLAHRDLLIPNDEHLLRELQYYEYELTEAGNVRLNARSGYTDDMVVALALAMWQARGAPDMGRSRFLTSGRRASGRDWGI